jgi:hypothetical protein
VTCTATRNNSFTRRNISFLPQAHKRRSYFIKVPAQIFFLIVTLPVITRVSNPRIIDSIHYAFPLKNEYNFYGHQILIVDTSTTAKHRDC